MKDHNQHEIQMSEAFLNSAFLALSGGFQDAYTYNARNEVFCNAQTGNVVLMSQHFMAGEVTAGLGYFFPIIFFALGVWVAEKIQANYKYAQKLHWRQGVLFAEILILFTEVSCQPNTICWQMPWHLSPVQCRYSPSAR